MLWRWNSDLYYSSYAHFRQYSRVLSSAYRECFIFNWNLDSFGEHRLPFSTNCSIDMSRNDYGICQFSSIRSYQRSISIDYVPFSNNEIISVHHNHRYYFSRIWRWYQRSISNAYFQLLNNNIMAILRNHCFRINFAYSSCVPGSAMIL